MTQEIELEQGEEFVPVRGFESYLISNHGRCYSTKSSRFIGAVNGSGYINVTLHDDEGKISFYVHQLVMTHFGPPPPENATEVDHLDRDRTNNNITNLRWVSRSENNRNRSGWGRNRYTYFDELPETAEPLDSYNGHDFDGLYIDYEREKLYVFNGLKYRELAPTRNRGNIYYQTYDVEDHKRRLSHLILFG